MNMMNTKAVTMNLTIEAIIKILSRMGYNLEEHSGCVSVTGAMGGIKWVFRADSNDAGKTWVYAYEPVNTASKIKWVHNTEIVGIYSAEDAEKAVRDCIMRLTGLWLNHVTSYN